jgi:hypothetical protein
VAGRTYRQYCGFARALEVVGERCQPVVRAGAFEERGGTLECLHSSSVAERAISAYIV